MMQTDETRRRAVHQRIQQAPGAALSAQVPGVSDRKAGQVDNHSSPKSLKKTKDKRILFKQHDENCESSFRVVMLLETDI